MEITDYCFVILTRNGLFSDVIKRMLTYQHNVLNFFSIYNFNIIFELR